MQKMCTIYAHLCQERRDLPMRTLRTRAMLFPPKPPHTCWTAVAGSMGGCGTHSQYEEKTKLRMYSASPLSCARPLRYWLGWRCLDSVYAGVW